MENNLKKELSSLNANKQIDPKFFSNLLSSLGITTRIIKSENVEDLHAEKLILRSILDGINDLIYLKDKNSKFILCNHATAKHLGLKSHKDLIGKTDKDYFQKEYADKYLKDDKNIIKTGKPLINIEEKTVDHKGNEKWLLTTKFPLKNNKKQVVGIIGIGKDVTDIIGSEKDLTKKYTSLRDHDNFNFKAILQNIIDNSTDNIYIKDKKGTFILINKSQSNWLGLKSPEEALGKTDFDYFSEKHATRAQKDELTILKSKKSISIEEEDIWRSGKKAWVLTKKYPFYNEDGEIIGTFGVTRDITQRKIAEDALFIEKELVNATLMSIGDAVISTDNEAKIVCMNPVAEKLTGWNENEAKGKKLINVFNILHENDKRKAHNPIDIVLRRNRVISTAGDIVLVNKHDIEIPIKETYSPIHNKQGQITGAVLVFHDDTVAREKTNKMSYRATHDALTGLFNRTEFERQMNDLLKNAKTVGEQHAFLYFDLDKFKPVNDQCGHLAGDYLLRNLSKFIQMLLRDTDTLARLGGDEFGILLKNCSLKHANIIATKIIQSVKEYQFIWEGKTFTVGISMGIVSINEDSENKESILVDADISMYTAKENGGNCIHITIGDEENIKKTQWETRINLALEHNLFQLYKQVILPISNNRGKKAINYYEILLRMIDNENNIIMPKIFLNTAERYGLMPKIDQWVIKNVFSYINKNKNTNTVYFINLSCGSISDELIIFINEQLSKYKIPAKTICFEVNETSAITNIVKVIELIKHIKKWNCLFSLDNIGLSTLSYLKYLNVDFIKIDNSLIENIDHHKVNATSVKAINDIASVKNIKTIASCVEYDEVKNKLVELGIGLGQGYNIGIPEPL